MTTPVFVISAVLSGTIIELSSFIKSCSRAILIIEPLVSVTIYDRSSHDAHDAIDIRLGDYTQVTWISNTWHKEISFYSGQSSNLYGVQVIIHQPSCQQQLIFTMNHESAQTNWTILPSLPTYAHYKLVTQQIHTASDTKSRVHIIGHATHYAHFYYHGIISTANNISEINIFQHCSLINLGTNIYAHMLPCFSIKSPGVLCSHEAAHGNLNKQQITYIMTRGLTINRAKKIILKSMQLRALDQPLAPNARSFIEEILEEGLSDL